MLQSGPGRGTEMQIDQLKRREFITCLAARQPRGRSRGAPSRRRCKGGANGRDLAPILPSQLWPQISEWLKFFICGNPEKELFSACRVPPTLGSWGGTFPAVCSCRGERSGGHQCEVTAFDETLRELKLSSRHDPLVERVAQLLSSVRKKRSAMLPRFGLCA